MSSITVFTPFTDSAGTLQSDNARIRKASLDRGDAESMGYDKETENDFEVFKKGEDVVDFRTVSWPKASVIFLKGAIFTLLDGKCCC